MPKYISMAAVSRSRFLYRVSCKGPWKAFEWQLLVSPFLSFYRNGS